jgi:hypothetical protein
MEAAAQDTPSFRLLLHSRDGCVPHLTPRLLDQIFCADASDPSNTEWTWYRDHLILGLAATDTCITPVYSNKRRRNENDDVTTNSKKKRKTDTAADGQVESNDGDDADNKSNDAKKPSGYTFLTPAKTRAICNAVNSNSTDSTKNDTDPAAQNYIHDYLRVPTYIRTMVVPTFSFAAPPQAGTDGTKKFTSSKQSQNGSGKDKRQKNQKIEQQLVHKGTQNSVAIYTPHGWQSITPEQYGGAVASLAYPSEYVINDVGAVGLFDHLNITTQAPALFSKDQSGDISILKKQALKKITVSYQKCITWSSRVQTSVTSSNENCAMPSLWIPINIFTTFFPEHVLTKSFAAIKQNFLAESPNVAIVGWEAFPTNLHHVEKRKVLNKLLNTIESMTSSASLSTPKQVLVLAVNDVASILVAAREGVSIVGTDLVRVLSTEGIALVLDLTPTTTTTAKAERSTARDHQGGTLDLNDTKCAQDSQPILKGCTCLTCRVRKASIRPVGYSHFQKEAADETETPAFSRAYIHHLIRAKEMLADTLLFIHNLHQMVMLFHKLSEARAASKLESFCNFVESQL